MKTRLPVLLLALGLFASCASAPRTTTPEERARANESLTHVESIIVGLGIAGTIPPEDATLAIKQVNEFRDLVAASEHTPVSFAETLQRIVNFGAAWMAKKNAG